MALTEKKLNRKRLFSAYISSVLSMTLVILLVGVASLIIVNAGNISSYFKEHLQVSVIFDQETKEDEARFFCDSLSKEPYMNELTFITIEQGRKEMEELLGEDFLTVFDTAPIPVSADLSLKAEYVNAASMEKIIADLSASPLVEEVVWQKALIEALNANLRKISLVLGIFVILLTFISLVLIANTARLSLYGKRFSIHTMRLVGATKAFIRAPFLAEAAFQGCIAALLAIIMLIGTLLFIKSQFPLMFTVFQIQELLVVMSIMLACGILICLVTTFGVVNRLINLRKEELYF